MRCAPRSPSHTHARCPALHTTYCVPHTTCLIPRAPRPVHMPHTSHPVPRASYLISRTTQLVYTHRLGKGKVDNSIWIIGWGIKTLQVKYGSPVPPITGESILCIRHAYMYKARPHPICWGVYIMYMSLQGIFAAPTSLHSGRGVLINPAFHLVVR
jgi:hypothetical protein